MQLNRNNRVHTVQNITVLSKQCEKEMRLETKFGFADACPGLKDKPTINMFKRCRNVVDDEELLLLFLAL